MIYVNMVGYRRVYESSKEIGYFRQPDHKIWACQNWATNTLSWISALEQAVTNEEDAIQAGSEGSKHCLDNIEHFS